MNRRSFLKGLVAVAVGVILPTPAKAVPKFQHVPNKEMLLSISERAMEHARLAIIAEEDAKFLSMLRSV